MSLLNYFNENFYQRNELCQLLRIDDETLSAWQDNGLFPANSFALTNKLEVNSFLGINKHIEELEFYARGYINWGQVLIKHKVENATHAFTHFTHQFEQTLAKVVPELCEELLQCFTEDIEQTIQSNWQYFLMGKYGAVSMNGKIEEIVSIEVFKYAISFYTEDFSVECLEESKRKIVHKALKQLNSSVAHDFELLPKQLLRERYIERVIKHYDLSIT